MDQKEQINSLASDLDELIERYRHEWDLPYATVTGILHMKITVLELEAIEIFDDLED